MLNHHIALVIFSAALISPIANANFSLIAAESRWKAVEDVEPYLQTPVCRAITAASNSKEPIEFSLAYPKDAAMLPMIALRTKLAPSSIAVKISNTESESFFLLKAGATNEESNLFWYAPVGFARMESLVRAKNSLDLVLDPKGATPTNVQVSLAGSANALDAVKKCLKTTQVPAAFFQLLNAQKDNLTPDLGDRSPLFLFQTVQSAFAAYRAGQSIQVELAKLRATVAPLLAKETAALTVLKSANATYASSETKLLTAQQNEAALTAKLAESKALQASLQTEKPLAEADLAQKKAIFLPLQQKIALLDKAISDASKAVASAQAEVAKNEAVIAKNTRRIPELENESARLRKQIPSLQREEDRLSGIYDDADREYRDYDVRRETEKLLEREFDYDRAKRDLESAKREVDQLKSEYWAASSKLQETRSALENCQRQPNPSCSSESAAAQEADRHWTEVILKQNSAESDVRNFQRKVDDIESDVKRKVDRAQDELRSTRDSAESAYSNAKTAKDNAQNRVAEIRNAIPVLKKQIDTAQAALPALRAKLASTQATLAEKTADRERVSGEIGFEATKAAYLAADARLKDIVTRLAAVTKALPALAKQLTDAQKSTVALAKAFDVAKAAKASAEAKLAPIQDQLKGFRGEESVKLADLEVESVKFKTARAAYQDLLKLL